MAVNVEVQPIVPIVVVSDNATTIIPNLSGYATISYVSDVSGSIVDLINVSNAGVSSLNGLSGLINIFGTGSVFVTTSGQSIFISGSAINSQSIDTSGLISTGTADARYYPLNSNPSGYLNTLSGLSTGYVIGISGDLSSRLTETGLILDSKINNLSGYLDSNFATIDYVGGISGELNSKIQSGGGSGITSLNTLDGAVTLFSSLDNISFINSGQNIDILPKPQNIEIYRNLPGQITGVRYNVDFARIYRDGDDKITGVFYNNYCKKILYDGENRIVGTNISFL